MILPVGRDGDGSALWYSLPQSGVPSGAIRIRMRAVSMFTSRRMSARPRSVRRPWQIGHTAGAISAAPQEGSQSRRNYKAGCWQGVFREHVRSLPNISGLTGATAGKGAPSPWSRPDRAASCCSASCCSGASAEAVPFPRIAGRSTSLLRFSRRRESNEVGYE